jgi:hypothetical protein
MSDNIEDQFYNAAHGTWLVPVVVDRDGSLLVPCPALDDAMLDVSYWAAYCQRCGIVSGPVPGTVGVDDIDSLSDDAWESLQPWEVALNALHAVEVFVAAVEQRPFVALCPHLVDGETQADGLVLVE